ncbi:MAG: hypothetical protein IPF93_08335 [Saprospiraceae bacterium]|nr:hypothetical protein [Saprospiraceae bacterium]
MSEKVVDSICHDFIIAWLHLPGSNADMGLSIGSGVATYRNLGLFLANSSATFLAILSWLGS